MASAALNPKTEALVQAIFPPDFFEVDPREFEGVSPMRANQPKAANRLSLAGPGLLSGKDFLLPDLVAYAENGDPFVRVTSQSGDDSHVKEVLRLFESCAAQIRNFGDLASAEQQLQRRQYLDYVKRAPRNESQRQTRQTELAIWLQGGPQAEANFAQWWTRKEQRRQNGLLRKANRLANCGVSGRRLDCREHPEHRFYGAYDCQCRYCRQCGAKIFAALFGKYMGLWPTVQSLLPRPGFRSRVVTAKLDFTAVNLGRMPTSGEIREFNQDVRECIKRATRELGFGADSYGFLWCDEFGGWDPKRKTYNTNLHAHGVYVGPYMPQQLLVRIWTDIREHKDGAKVVWIERQKIDDPPDQFLECERRRFTRALGHALKYTGKHLKRSDGDRLADLEIAFHGVRRVHTMGLFYRTDLQCSAQCQFCKARCDGVNGHLGDHSCRHHGTENRCPLCGGHLVFPRESSYALISDLKKEGRSDLGQVRAQIARDRVFSGPRGPDA